MRLNKLYENTDNSVEEYDTGFFSCLDDYLKKLQSTGGKSKNTKTKHVEGIKNPKMPKDFKPKPNSGDTDKEQDQNTQNQEQGQNQQQKSSSNKKQLEGLPTGKLLSEKEVNDIRQKIESDKTMSEDLKKANKDAIDANTVSNSTVTVENKIRDFSNKVSKKNAIYSEFLDGILRASSKYDKLWKKILTGFIAGNSTFAGKMTTSDEIKWGSRKGIARGEIKSYEVKKPKIPQVINLCIDTSGSIDIELLEEMAQTIASLAKSKLYSGINIIPWDTNVYDTIPVEIQKGDIFEELKKCINMAKNAGGGGTDVTDLIRCINNDSKQPSHKNDLYIIISDGECYTGPISKLDLKPAKRTIAIIYNTNTSIFADWMQHFDKKHFAAINR